METPEQTAIIDAPVAENVELSNKINVAAENGTSAVVLESIQSSSFPATITVGENTRTGSLRLVQDGIEFIADGENGVSCRLIDAFTAQAVPRFLDFKLISNLQFSKDENSVEFQHSEIDGTAASHKLSSPAIAEMRKRLDAFNSKPTESQILQQSQADNHAVESDSDESELIADDTPQDQQAAFGERTETQDTQDSAVTTESTQDHEANTNPFPPRRKVDKPALLLDITQAQLMSAKQRLESKDSLATIDQAPASPSAMQKSQSHASLASQATMQSEVGPAVPPKTGSSKPASWYNSLRRRPKTASQDSVDAMRKTEDDVKNVAPEEIKRSSKLFGSLSILDKRRDTPTNGSAANSTSSLPDDGNESTRDLFKRHLFGRLKTRPSESTSAVASSDSIAAVSADDKTVVRKTDEFDRDILVKRLRNGKYEITAGTMEMLVESLTEETAPDTIYIETFLLTFRHFTTPLQLLGMLQSRYNLRNTQTLHPEIIPMRVITVLKKWVEKHYYDFRTPEIIAALNLFIEEIGRSSLARFGQQIKQVIDAELERAKTFKEAEKAEVPADVRHVLTTVDFATAWTPKKIAQELTIVDVRLFRQMKPDEFCLFLWGDKNDPRLANFNAYIAHFNRVSFWVVTQVCSCFDMKKRAEMIEKMIHIMKYCLKYQNYNTLMAMHAGLNMNSVSRLKRTWEIVLRSKFGAVYKDIDDRMTYKSNYKAYREIESNSKTPFIPFFGLYVKDMTFMNDGNQKHVANKVQRSTTGETVPIFSSPLSHRDSGSHPHSPLSMRQPTNASTESGSTEVVAAPTEVQLINFDKCQAISQKIHSLRIFQQSTYKFEDERAAKEGPGATDSTSSLYSPSTPCSTAPDAWMQHYFGHPHGPPAIESEKELYQMSRACEASSNAPDASAGTETSSLLRHKPSIRSRASIFSSHSGISS